MNLQLEEKSDEWMTSHGGFATACTDGRKIYYSKKFIEPLRDAQIKWLLAHETLHPAFGHLWRIGTRDRLKWNYAADFKVNQTLDEVNKEMVALGKPEPFEAIEGCVIDKRGQFTNKATEEVYWLLPEPPKDYQNIGGFVEPGAGDDKKEGTGNGNGNKDDNGQQQGNGQQPSQNNDALKQFWEDALVTATEMARMQGKCPAFAEREMKTVTKRGLPYAQILRNFFTTLTMSDYSYRRFNRKYLAYKMYLPSLYSETMGPVSVALDTSGSIYGDLLHNFFNQFQLILDTCKPEKIHYMECDAAIGKYIEMEYNTPFPAKYKHTGGGGTDFRPVFEKANTIPGLECLVYFTDLMGTFPSKAPSYPVLWIVPPSMRNSGVEQPKFGQVIYLYED